jgi:hypothetical protein
MAVIDPKSQEDCRAASEYWERITQRSDTDVWEPEFAKGFVEGALGIEFAAEDETDIGIEADSVTLESLSREVECNPDTDEFGKTLRQIELD